MGNVRTDSISYKETKSRDNKTLCYYNDPMNDQEYFQYSSATVFQKNYCQT